MKTNHLALFYLVRKDASRIIQPQPPSGAMGSRSSGAGFLSLAELGASFWAILHQSTCKEKGVKMVLLGYRTSGNELCARGRE